MAAPSPCAWRRQARLTARTRPIHQQVDGINHTLNGAIDHLDAVLAARIQRLTSFINDFIANLN